MMLYKKAALRNEKRQTEILGTGEGLLGHLSVCGGAGELPQGTGTWHLSPHTQTAGTNF